MSNEIVKIDANKSLSAMTESQILAVLKSSLYPGASDDSVKMVLILSSLEHRDHRR